MWYVVQTPNRYIEVVAVPPVTGVILHSFPENQKEKALDFASQERDHIRKRQVTQPPEL